MANGVDRQTIKEHAQRSSDFVALAMALLFVIFGLGAIYVVAQVAEAKDGAVLATVLIVPALLYLMLSGRVQDLKGPAGLEVTLAEVAKQSIPGPSTDSPAGTLSYEELHEVGTGRMTSFGDRITDIPSESPVILTMTLGSEIDPEAAANYAKGLTQFPRFRFVAILDSEKHGKLVSYMDANAFRHLIEADVSGVELLNDIRDKNIAELATFPGMIDKEATVTPDTSMADALRQMEGHNPPLNALLVRDDCRVKGIIERERIANALLLSLVDHGPG